ncbi:hypothetical protein BT96DRAFT_998144 [Gymnopus androsaceus JB14]|uniref:Phosphatidate phosphatase APP1 catalytic domain-containing protein n=1 Tax=Gymnopus androsaceus JB14 TaxID=1447944 RepID=A0A6A4H9T9_9AGAR|nr:hypothetical protein BT96DRAFT_998144 [Gymnopus androsaceus JB14]
MIPRFINPHLAHAPTEKTSREIALQDADGQFPSEGNPPDVDSEERLLLLNKLHKRLQDSLDFVVEGHKSRKRRKLSESQTQAQPVASPEPILFKLISREEKLINIEPGPPKPPPCYREPTYEDSEKYAVRRRERSQAVAVDFAWVMRESHKTQLPFPSWSSRVMQATTAEPIATSPIIILQHLQPLKKTRPPVPVEMLAHHPYAVGASPHPDAQRKLQKDIPLVDVTIRSLKTDLPARKRKRKRRRSINARALYNRICSSYLFLSASVIRATVLDLFDLNEGASECQLSHSTEDLLKSVKLPPRPNDNTEDYEVKLLEREFQSLNHSEDGESTHSGPSSSRSSSIYDLPSKDSHSPESSFGTAKNVAADEIRKLHANLESRLQPLWSSVVPNRTVRLRLYTSLHLDDNPSVDKAGVLELLNAFPDSKFLLVGDSGEQDLELYTELGWLKRDLARFIHDTGSGETLDDSTGAKSHYDLPRLV